jgi:hypothetical protein
MFVVSGLDCAIALVAASKKLKAMMAGFIFNLWLAKYRSSLIRISGFASLLQSNANQPDKPVDLASARSPVSAPVRAGKSSHRERNGRKCRRLCRALLRHYSGRCCSRRRNSGSLWMGAIARSRNRNSTVPQRLSR